MVQFSAAGYDSFVAGIDEVSARAALAEMQARLASDPASALGVTASATAEDVRSAFLQLTKLYHPVRFGRMATEIQKLSNEVFLALRAAHDSVAKSARRRSGPIAMPRTTSPGLSPSHGAAVIPGTVGPSPGQAAAPGRTTQPLASRPMRPHDPGDRPAQPQPPIPVTPPGGMKPVRPHDPGDRPAQPQPPIPVTPSGGTRVGTRISAPPPMSRATLRPIGSASTGSPRDEAAVLDLLQRQQWDQARSALHQLSAREPTSKRIRALMCYARGREAQLGGRVDDARVELQDALELDPELQLAKTALTELFTRRK